MNKILTKIKYGVFICIILTLITNCTLIPCDWDSDLNLVEKKPQDKFIIGKYKLDKRTLKKIKGYENSQNTELIINTDGTFEVKNTPKGIMHFMRFENSDEINTTSTGEWKSSYNKGTAQLHVSIKCDTTNTGVTGFGALWRIYEKNNKAVIFIMVDNPDECTAVRFEKDKK